MSKVGTLDAFTARVLRRLGKVESEKMTPSPEAQADLIGEALDLYDRHRPHAQVHEREGSDVARRFVLPALITGWRSGTDRVLDVAQVMGANTDDEIEATYPATDWTVTRDTTGQDVLRLAWAPGSGTTLRIRYATPHALHATDAALSTVPDGDAEALTLLGVTVFAAWIARSAADMANQALGADQVDYSNISSRWDKRGKDAYAAALRLLTPEAETHRASGASVTWESTSLLARQPRVGH